MERKKKSGVSINNSFVIAIAVPGLILIITLVVSIVLAIMYIKTTDRNVLFGLIGSFIFMMVIYVSASYLIIRSLYSTYFEGLYLVTKNNLKVVRSGRTDMKRYPNTRVKELEELNKDVDIINSRFSNATLVATEPDYSRLGLVYVDKEKGIVDYNSFMNQLPNIVFLSQSFRNVLIDASFDTELTEEQKDGLFAICDKIFSRYNQRLYSYREHNKSLIIYLPVISSFKRIEEQIETIIREASITVRQITGAVNVPIRFSIVSYPYSDADELLSDLRYARRQGKTINFYLPNRVKINRENTNLLSNTMNLNYMNRIISSLSDLNFDNLNREHDTEIITRTLDDVCEYLSIDEATVFLFDDVHMRFKRIAHNTDARIVSDDVEDEFLQVISENVDPDGSYYFANPSMANNSLGRFIDILHFDGGFFYLIKNEKQTIGLVSFFNYNHDFIIDSYLRESLFILSLRLEHYFKEMKRIEEIDLYRNETDYVLSLSNYSLYRIDKDYNIVIFSQDMKEKFKDICIGEKCYKAIFGSEHPCHDCPLKTMKKKTFKIGNVSYQSSLTLNDRQAKNKNVLIERLETEEAISDVYDKDLLINSFAQMVLNIKNSYHINGRGYVILMKIDNIDDLITDRGSEGSLFVLRSFLRELKKRLKTTEFYYYTSDVIALVMHGVGHVDVINTCEKIYEISKQHFYEDNNGVDSLNITYLPVSWPRGFASSEDFLRHCDDYMFKGKYETNKDFIYFADEAISRSASKRAFMLAVIEQEFSSGSFSSVSLQPIVRAKDKRIFGAEILLRINNVYSNAVFNAEEISRIAEQEGKTSIITESLIDFIGNMYKEYGSSVFKINAFSRICINIDSTYLKDASLINGITKLNDTYSFPKGFLSFEIPEEIIPQYQVEIQKLLRDLASANIMLSVDRYTGQHISIEKLKELGFKEIKLTRDLVGKIDTDSVRFNEVKDIINTAKANGISVAVVGVENSQQFVILKEFDENMMMQGYHFYKPLSRADFISALISHNR